MTKPIVAAYGLSKALENVSVHNYLWEMESAAKVKGELHWSPRQVKNKLHARVYPATDPQHLLTQCVIPAYLYLASAQKRPFTRPMFECADGIYPSKFWLNPLLTPCIYWSIKPWHHFLGMVIVNILFTSVARYHSLNIRDTYKSANDWNRNTVSVIQARSCSAERDDAVS